MVSNLKTTLLYVTTSLMICSCVTAENDCGSKTFAKSPLYINLKPKDTSLKEIKATSVMECATKCSWNDKCTAFIANSQESVCSMYGKRHKTMTFLEQPGARSYESISRDQSDCYDVFMKGLHNNGVYSITPSGSSSPVNVYCEVSSNDGGWLVFQRRTDGSEDFQRTWNEYRDGFGDLNNEFWLGNSNIHRITSQGYYDLKIDLEDFEGNRKYALYKNFSVSSEEDFFKLSIGAYSRDAGDSLTFHNGYGFTTKYRDHDSTSITNCAVYFKGAWWFNDCHRADLNGQYLGGPHTSSADGVNWVDWKGLNYSLKKTVMKLRPMQF